tara:strand:- start:15055 stop:16794 length:1740 start_codon:yes stop_codon:yes gene_type:complete
MIDFIENQIAIYLKSIESIDENLLGNLEKRINTSICDDISNGHLTSNAAMVIASSLKMNPKSLSSNLVDIFTKSNRFEHVESAGPGFINFFLKRKDFVATVTEVNQSEESYGKSNIGDNKKVQIEFVSANPTGPLHVGHGRGAAFGDALCRILNSIGYTVEKEYYVNDAGRQIDILTASVILKIKNNLGVKPKNAYQGEYITNIANSYIKNTKDFNLQIDSKSFLNLSDDPEEEIDQIIILLRESDSKTWDRIKDFSLGSILESIKKDLSDFNVNFKNWFFESSLGKIEDTKSEIGSSIHKLQQKGQAYLKEGAIWLDTEKSGDDKHRVLVREDGRHTYFASDVAYHKNKIDRGYDKLINVWGADHHGYIKRIESSIEALGSSKSILKVQLVQFANLFKNGKKIKMSTRSGDFFSLKDLIDEIGSDVARFYYLSKQADQHLDFDIDLAKSDSKENMFYYIQYAYARISSLEKKYAEVYQSIPNSMDLITDKSFIKCDKLIHEMAKFPKIILKAGSLYQPHLIIFYLKDLAQMFHSFYNENKIITGNQKQDESILYCLKAVKNIVGIGLNLIGIKPIKEM